MTNLSWRVIADAHTEPRWREFQNFCGKFFGASVQLRAQYRPPFEPASGNFFVRRRFWPPGRGRISNLRGTIRRLGVNFCHGKEKVPHPNDAAGDMGKDTTHFLIFRYSGNVYSSRHRPSGRRYFRPASRTTQCARSSYSRCLVFRSSRSANPSCAFHLRSASGERATTFSGPQLPSTSPRGVLSNSGSCSQISRASGSAVTPTSPR